MLQVKNMMRKISSQSITINKTHETEESKKDDNAESKDMLLQDSV